MPASEQQTAVLADHAGACVVCPHAWPEHDPTGVRFCTATAAAALSRGCICR